MQSDNPTNFASELIVKLKSSDFKAVDLISVDGKTIDSMTDDELVEAISKYRVYARVNTNTKLRIVEAFQAKGLIVAMIGDGVSDAMAIQK